MESRIALNRDPIRAANAVYCAEKAANALNSARRFFQAEGYSLPCEVLLKGRPAVVAWMQGGLEGIPPAVYHVAKEHSEDVLSRAPWPAPITPAVARMLQLSDEVFSVKASARAQAEEEATIYATTAEQREAYRVATDLAKALEDAEKWAHIHSLAGDITDPRTGIVQRTQEGWTINGFVIACARPAAPTPAKPKAIGGKSAELESLKSRFEKALNT